LKILLRSSKYIVRIGFSSAERLKKLSIDKFKLLVMPRISTKYYLRSFHTSYLNFVDFPHELELDSILNKSPMLKLFHEAMGSFFSILTAVIDESFSK